MQYVYLLASEVYAKANDAGYATKLRMRLADHDAGSNASTRLGRPWRLEFFMAFRNKQAAMEFETYQNTPSGNAFAPRSASRLGDAWRA